LEEKDWRIEVLSEEQSLPEVKNSEPANTEQANKNPKKIILICVLGVLVLSLICWQVIGSVLFDRNVKNYATVLDGIEKKQEILLKNDVFSLVQVLQNLKDIQKENKELLLEANTFIDKNKFILVKNTGVINAITKNDSKLEQLLAGSKELASAIQRSEQMDKDVDLMLNSKTATWKNTFDRCEALIKDNETIKNDLVKVVIPEEIKKYQDILVEALTEKGLYLACFNDAMNSAFNAETNLNISKNYYYNAYFYSDIKRSYNYAVESLKYMTQADDQAQEGKEHWDKYKKLKEKIKAEGEAV
jgi:hypothetical protein